MCLGYRGNGRLLPVLHQQPWSSVSRFCGDVLLKLNDWLTNNGDEIWSSVSAVTATDQHWPLTDHWPRCTHGRRRFMIVAQRFIRCGVYSCRTRSHITPVSHCPILAVSLHSSRPTCAQYALSQRQITALDATVASPGRLVLMEHSTQCFMLHTRVKFWSTWLHMLADYLSTWFLKTCTTISVRESIHVYYCPSLLMVSY